LYTLAWHVTGNQADAEDVVHDVFVGLQRALDGYRERGRFEAWLRRLVVRTALMRRRRINRQANRDSSYASEQSPSSDPMELPGDAGRLLATLPESLRAVMVLRELEGMSHVEIAKALGISEAASRLRLFRGFERLRKLVKRER